MPNIIDPTAAKAQANKPSDHKLVGKDYSTPDLIAKVQGKSKYAEDYRADGMLFCKLLLSPVPHGRVRNIDMSAALAMPGVKAILTEHDLPAPADALTDNGTVIPADKMAERGLTMEPLYQGEPILAVCAESELIAAEAIERIKLDIERLPFVVDPLVSLRPGGPNARVEGNVWVRPALPRHQVNAAVSAGRGGPGGRGGANGGRGGAFGPAEIHEVKWANDHTDDLNAGRLPMGKFNVHVDTKPVADDLQKRLAESRSDAEKAQFQKQLDALAAPRDVANDSDAWEYGDVDAAFKNAALVLDETFVTPNTSHECMETRTAMAYWENGKVYMYTGTQSTAQTAPAIARWLGLLDAKGMPDVSRVVFVSEYTGGGFGSKITGAISLIIPALLSKKTGAPVMMRISREEEFYIGRGRPSLHGRMKIAFSKEGRITGLDMFTVCDNGPYGAGGDAGSAGRIVSLLYQPETIRYKCITVLTNTPPRSAQSAPGGMQGITLIEPVLSKAARKLGIDQVAIRRLNAPEGKAKFGPAGGPRRQRAYCTSSFIKEALDKGAEQFNWAERKARSPQRSGTKVRGVGVSVSCYVGGSVGFDGLVLLKPDGNVCFQSGIGNHGTESVHDVHRVAAEMIGIPWDKCEICWGNTTKDLPWTCASGGSQTTHAMTRAAYAVALDMKQKLQELAAMKLGGKPEDYVVANERVARKGGGAGMSLAQAAQYAIQVGGKYDGHEAPPDVNKMTKTSIAALAGQGLIAAARDKAPHDGQTHSFVATFAEVEVDTETGKYQIVDFLAVADVGTVIHPKALGGQVLGRSTLGIGHAIGQKWVFDQHYGLPLAKRFYNNKPPTILDVPSNMKWAALDIPDPETPAGARGIGEPPVGGGCASILNALTEALGDEVIRRAPVSVDLIVESLELGRPAGERLTAHV